MGDLDNKNVTVSLCGIEMNVKVASLPQTQMKGYMNGKVEPSDNEGMIFIFDEEIPLKFWMKNVKFPLDIIFFDSHLNYLNHYTMQCGSTKSYESIKPAMYALETRAGWCDRHLKGKPFLQIKM
jgi:hypothetical protein